MWERIRDDINNFVQYITVLYVKHLQYIWGMRINSKLRIQQ